MGRSQQLRLVRDKTAADSNYRRLVGELWSSQQRQMHSLHYAVSYRGSFKPELPDFCIKRYSEKGAVVLDPFSGQGTTALQANLLGRVAWACDINPLSARLTRAKTTPAGLDEIVLRLNEVDFCRPVEMGGYSEKLSPFYHPDTYRELINLRAFLRAKDDRISRFIELLAISRLHGHSAGFFSAYSFPQISIPPERQRMINIKRRQAPDYRALAPRIIKKAAQALRDGFSSDFFAVSSANMVSVSDSRAMTGVPSNSVDLIVTSPPFLDKVDYLADNWLEFWFAGIDPRQFAPNVVMCSSLEEWSLFISDVMCEMARVLKPRAYAVIEVGEVQSSAGTIYLDEVVADQARHINLPDKKLVVDQVLVNQQQFTRLADCFQVDTTKKVNNTNRLVVMKCVPKVKPRRRSLKQ